MRKIHKNYLIVHTGFLSICLVIWVAIVFSNEKHIFGNHSFGLKIQNQVHNRIVKIKNKHKEITLRQYIM